MILLPSEKAILHALIGQALDQSHEDAPAWYPLCSLMGEEETQKNEQKLALALDRIAKVLE